jgi:hypothetical protein
MTDVASAHRNVIKAEEAVTNAERARDEAYAGLDQALAERGWVRLMGGFDGRLYTYRGGEPQPLDAVLRYETAVTA